MHQTADRSIWLLFVIGIPLVLMVLGAIATLVMLLVARRTRVFGLMILGMLGVGVGVAVLAGVWLGQGRSQASAALARAETLNVRRVAST